VCTTWGVFYNEKTGLTNIILLDCWRDKVEFPDLKAAALNLYKEWEPDACVIEQKSAGEALIAEFRRMGIFVEDFTPVRGGGDKVGRVNAVTDIFSSGCVWTLNREWTPIVLEEAQAFPMGANDDIVDTIAMALSRFRRGTFIQLPSEEVEDEPSLK
jgi:predicted phage terminase large subunit-like protein